MSEDLDDKFEKICNLIEKFEYKNEIVRVYGCSRTYEHEVKSDYPNIGEKYIQIEFLERGTLVHKDQLDVPFNEEFIDELEKLSDDQWEYIGTEGEPGALTISNTETAIYDHEDGYTRVENY